MLFAEWYQINEQHGTNDPAINHFISQLQQSGYLNGDETTDLFFRMITVISLLFDVLSVNDKILNFCKNGMITFV